MSQHRDPHVAEALRRLDVPDHGPDFWAALEARLVDEDLATDTGTDHEWSAGEADVVDLAASPAARRRLAEGNRTPMLALVAAVAIVVALVVGAGFLGGDGDDESQVDMAGETDGDAAPPTVPETTTPDTTEVPQTTATAPEALDEAEAEQTAVAWIDSLAAGDILGAYDQLDDVSQARMDRGQLEELSSGLFEGAAAFAQPGVTRAATVLDGPDVSLAVVTFTGDVEREGMVETASYPVVVTGTGVHFTLDGPQLELDDEYARSSGTTLASPLELLVSDTALVWVWFDDGDPQLLDGRGAVALDVEAAAGAGTHLVHLVAVEGGAVTARSYTVVVP